MPNHKLEERVAALENEVAVLKEKLRSATEKDWRRTLGMFTDDEGMKELFQEALMLREIDRARVRRPTKRKPSRDRQVRR